MSALPRSKADIAIIGAGVSGLTTALALVEAGYRPRIHARETWRSATSAVAGGIWYPYLAEPREKVLAWGRQTLDRGYALAQIPGTGVSICQCREMSRVRIEMPWWAEAVRHVRRLEPHELVGDAVDGFLFESIVMDVPNYLTFLERSLDTHAVQVELHPGGFTNLADLAKPGRVIVNCTGLASRELAHDPSVVPVRGQTVRVRNPGGIDCYLDEHNPAGLTYVVSRAEDIILGGTADFGSEELTADEATSTRIRDQTSRLDLRLASADVLEVRVGLRPFRNVVRVERDLSFHDSLVLHNYGHGGAGFTLSWGCARDIVSLVQLGLRD